jgi:oligopeptidase B
MRTITRSLALLMLINASNPSAAQPPVAKKIPHPTVIHGQTLPDDYFWMRDKQDPSVMEHLKAEEAYTQSVMEPTKPLQETLYQEFLARIQEDDSIPPYRWGDYEYFSKTAKGKQYRIYCRYPQGQPDKVETLLDLNQLAVGHSFMALGHYEMSDDHQWLAYSLDKTGYRQYELNFRPLSPSPNTQTLPVFARVTSLVWCSDNRSVVFVTEDEVTKRSDRCWLYRLGDQKPTQLFEEKDELYDIGVYRSRDGQKLFLRSMAKTSSEIRYADASKPLDWKLFAPRTEGHEYDVDWRGQHFYIRSNRGAVNFAVYTAPESHPDQWSVLLPHRLECKIEHIELFKNFVAVAKRENAYPEITILRTKGDSPVVEDSYQIPCPDPIHAVDIGINHQYDTAKLRFDYESPITPDTTYLLDVPTKQLTLLKRMPVLGGFKSENYRCQTLKLKARDGTEIPVSAIYSANLDLTKPNPLVLYGYGSYGISIDPNFNSNRFSLLDRGVVYAIAHIRGGGELGEPWRNQGRMDAKMTTFHDFADVAQGLIQSGWTQADQLVSIGGSAGGLLMGAVANQRPDLFAGMVAKVPFVDVMNTMLDASLPLTTGEYTEWGNPNQAQAFETMRAYSPYDNVAHLKYPSLMIEVSLNDSQVPYWEGAKWAAKLREYNQGQQPILLHTNFGAGHGGASGRYDALREQAFDYAYMLWRCGVFTAP